MLVNIYDHILNWQPESYSPYRPQKTRLSSDSLSISAFRSLLLYQHPLRLLLYQHSLKRPLMRLQVQQSLTRLRIVGPSLTFLRPALLLVHAHDRPTTAGRQHCHILPANARPRNHPAGGQGGGPSGESSFLMSMRCGERARRSGGERFSAWPAGRRHFPDRLRINLEQDGHPVEEMPLDELANVADA